MTKCQNCVTQIITFAPNFVVAFNKEKLDLSADNPYRANNKFSFGFLAPLIIGSILFIFLHNIGGSCFAQYAMRARTDTRY